MPHDHDRQYFIGNVFDSSARIAVEPHEFKKYVGARKLILEMREIEHAFELFAQSFVDFEMQMAATALEYLSGFPDTSGSADFFANHRRTLNLKVMGFLACHSVYFTLVQKHTGDTKKNNSLSSTLRAG